MSSNDRGRLHALDGLRGGCACLVMLFHIEFLSAGFTGGTFVRHSFLLVDFFFVLSGFVITRSAAARLGNDLPLRRFLVSRLATIYPLYLLMLLAILAIGAAATIGGFRTASADPGAIEDARAWLASAVMLQGVLLTWPLVWNVPGWSVAAEMMTYLFCGGLMRFAGRGLPYAMALVWIGALTLLLTQGATIEVFGKLGVARCLYGFSTGYFAYLAYRRLAATRANLTRRTLTVAETVLTIAVIAFIVSAAKTGWSLAAPMVFAASILLHAEGRGLISAGWGWRPLTKLGDWSYALYICHFAIEHRLARPVLIRLVPHGWLTNPSAASLIAVAIAALCIVAAAGLTLWVQAPVRRPVERLLMRLIGPRGGNSSRSAALHLDPAPDRADLARLATGERVAG